jgi:twitching motility protein PilT
MEEGNGRVPAVEVMVTTSRIRECIEDKDKTKEIHDSVSKGYSTYGMQTFDQSIMGLLKKGLISYDEAMRQTSNPDDFALKVKGVTSDSDMGWKDFEKEKTETEGEDEGEVDIERF